MRAAVLAAMDQRLAPSLRLPKSPPLATGVTTALFLTLGCACLIIPYATFVTLPQPLLVWTTFVVLLAAVLATQAVAKETHLGRWTAPVSLLSVFYFLRYGWGTVVTEYWEDYPWKVVPGLRWRFHQYGAWETLPHACYLILIFGAGLVVGGILAATRRTSALPSFSWPLDETKLKSSLMFYAPPAIVINSLIQFALPRSIRATVALFGYMIYPSILLGSYWLFKATTRREKARWTLFLVVTSLGSIPVGLVTGQVAGLLTPGMMVVLGRLVAGGRPPWKAVAFILPLAFLVLLPFASAYKFKTEKEWPLQQRVTTALHYFSTVGVRGRMELSMERSVGRFAGNYMPAVYARYYPNVYPFEMGRTFLIEASTMIPRLMWPDKPILSWELNHYSLLVGLVRQGDDTSAVFDAPSEYFMNFGAAGMFLLAIAHGYYWQALYNWLVLKVHALVGLAIFMTLFSENLDFFGIGQSLVTHIKTIPVWLILFYFCSNRRQRYERLRA